MEFYVRCWLDLFVGLHCVPRYNTQLCRIRAPPCTFIERNWQKKACSVCSKQTDASSPWCMTTCRVVRIGTTTIPTRTFFSASTNIVKTSRRHTAHTMPRHTLPCLIFVRVTSASQRVLLARHEHTSLILHKMNTQLSKCTLNPLYSVT